MSPLIALQDTLSKVLLIEGNKSPRKPEIEIYMSEEFYQALRKEISELDVMVSVSYEEMLKDEFWGYPIYRFRPSLSDPDHTPLFRIHVLEIGRDINFEKRMGVT